MFPELLIGGLLVAITVAIHAGGMGLMLKSLLKQTALPPLQFWPVTWLLIRMTWQLILIHLVEITVWAFFYWLKRCLPDAESSLYFAGVTYTTLGYGDLVLPKEWRLLGPIEGLTGILMCGLSTGFFFGVVSKLFSSKTNK